MVLPVMAPHRPPQTACGSQSMMVRACLILGGLFTLVAINSFLELDFLMDMQQKKSAVTTVDLLTATFDPPPTKHTTTSSSSTSSTNHQLRSPGETSSLAQMQDPQGYVSDDENDDEEEEDGLTATNPNNHGDDDNIDDDDGVVDDDDEEDHAPQSGDEDDGNGHNGDLSNQSKPQHSPDSNDEQEFNTEDSIDAESEESPLSYRQAFETQKINARKSSWKASATMRAQLPWHVVWLMSFPNSGTTYTLKFVQTSTNTTTATNYGAIEQDCCETTIPVDPSYTDGPYWRHPFKPKPTGTKLILTKTHCGADDPDVMAHDNDIEGHCRLSYKRVDNRIIYGEHSRSLVAKAVHLIRNPFDNIVARMHYRQHLLVQSKEVSTQAFGLTFNSTYTGFQSFCRWVDQYTVEQKKKQWHAQFPELETWMNMLHPVPCYTEFVRWLRWHEQIVEMLDNEIKVPVLNLYYERYATDFETTTGQLLDFLELKQSQEPLTFVVGKTYPEFYDPQQVVAIRTLIQGLATPKVWDMIRHYFE